MSSVREDDEGRKNSNSNSRLTGVKIKQCGGEQGEPPYLGWSGRKWHLSGAGRWTLGQASSAHVVGRDRGGESSRHWGDRCKDKMVTSSGRWGGVHMMD